MPISLKTARKIARLTQEELAAQAGVNVAVINRLEKGIRRGCRFDTAVKIARVLNVDPEELFEVPEDSDGPEEMSDVG